MKVRLSQTLFILTCLAMLVLGAILLIKADETPAPGIFMVGAAVIALIWRYQRNRHPRRVVSLTDEDESRPGQWDMDIYEQEAERRRRGESDT